MPVDVSIYNRLNPPDPIAGMAGTVGLANAVTQNRMLNAQNQLLQNKNENDDKYPSIPDDWING